MFSGIVEQTGRVAALVADAVTSAGDSRAWRLEIAAPEYFDALPLGASVAVNGACLTLAQRGAGVGCFDVVPETLRLTNLGALRCGEEVNLERSLRVGDRLDGHFVQGHVDGLGRVTRVDTGAGQWIMWVAPPAPLLEFIVTKGSITIDGVSLTVAQVAAGEFAVALIPTTLERTTLGRLQPGAGVNLETDILARLVITRLRGLVPLAFGDCAGGRGA